MLHQLAQLNEIYTTSGWPVQTLSGFNSRTCQREPRSMTSGGSAESDRPRKVDVLSPRQLHQSRLIIMMDGGGARANEGRKTFSRAQRGGVRLTQMRVSEGG